MSLTTVSTVLPESISHDLRADILAGNAAPGSTFTESAVALRFGVARPTAKMAIERLVTEGVLRREKNQAARVPVLTRDDIVDLLDMRSVIEGAAVSRLAIRGTIPAEALAAHHAIQNAEAYVETVAALDVAFHRSLVTGQPSVRLQRMHSLLMGEIELCIGQVLAGRLRTAADIAVEHQEILDAVTSGNPELAEELTRSHIAVTRTRLLEQFDAHDH